MAWLFLITAGLFECGWAIGLKYTDGFSRPIPSLLTILALVISMWALSIAMKTIPVGTAYAVWTGIGAVGVSVLGMVLFQILSKHKHLHKPGPIHHALSRELTNYLPLCWNLLY